MKTATTSLPQAFRFLERNSLFVGGLCLVLLSTSGCEFSSSGTADNSGPEIPDFVTDDSASAAQNSDTVSAELALHLKVGDRFPLKKTVEQTLTQSTVTGNSGKNEARIGLTFVISVDAVEPDRTKLTVRYDRIRYHHDIAGDLVDFDSN